MTITKSNKHKPSLNHDKPNEKGGYILATPYALMRSFILDYQISITLLGSCSPLHSKVFPQLNKWAREPQCMSWTCIYTPHIQTYPVGSKLATHEGTERACQSDRTLPVRVTGRVRSVPNAYCDASTNR